MKILYIEDNPVDVDLTLRKLKTTLPHADIAIVRSQAEALAFIRGPQFSDYDLVLTDMHLQDGDGIAILSHIRGHSLPVAVVILTGQGDEEAAVASLKAGADDYVVKKEGYLDNLHNLLKAATVSYNKKSDMGIQLLKILYLEHNQADVDLTRRHLKQHAPHIHMESLGHVFDFYELLHKPDALSSYSILLLDYRLPQENALEILKQIQESPIAEIPVVLVTGTGDEEIAVQALKMGAFDYVVKNQGYLFKLPTIVENAYYSMRLSREHAALLESETRLRTLIETLPDLIWLKDQKGVFLTCNPRFERFFGAKKSQIVGKTDYDFVDKELADFFRKNDKIAMTTNKACVNEEEVTYADDGHRETLETIKTPLLDHEGKLLGVLGVGRDITDRIKSEKKLKEYSENLESLVSERTEALLRTQQELVSQEKLAAIGKLSGSIAHDIRNPLGTISNSIYFLAKTADKPNIELLKKHVLIMEQEINRANDIISDLLDFSRENKPSFIKEDLNKIILKLLEECTISEEVTIVTDLVPDLPKIPIDRLQIRRVFHNLITNAIQAMKEGGQLTITTRKLEKGVEILIHNTGEGITHEEADKIYEPLFTTKSKGVGLGLTIAKDFIEKHNGSIVLESQTDKGTTFIIVLPEKQEAET